MTTSSQPPSGGQPIKPGPWVSRHKVLTGVGALLALCLIGSAFNNASNDGKKAAANRIEASTRLSPSHTATPTTNGQQADAAREAALKSAAASASRAAVSEAAAAKAMAAAKASAAARASSAAKASAAARASSAATSSAAAKASAAARAAQASASEAAAKPSPSNCTPGYSPCIPLASDVDCAGGSGNGPAYVQGPVSVTGDDPYDLDRDGDGVGCES